jgi:hypothetical protein
MKLNNFFRSSCLAIAVAAMGLTTGCSPDEADSGSQLFNDSVDATYTLSQTDTNGNRYKSSGSTSEDVKIHLWRYMSVANEVDSGDMVGGPEQDFFFPDPGTYVIRHTVVAYYGGSNSVSEKTVVVASGDPEAGNLVVNGRFAEGQAGWTILNISAAGAAWTFADQKATVTATGYNQQGIYQVVNVQGGKPYKVDLKVSGPGSINTWFEVYVSPTAPVQNNDYNADGIRMQLNTWAGCATTAFEGQLSAVGCGGSGNTMTFANDGPVYLVIKCGGENANSITIDNVEMRRVL